MISTLASTPVTAQDVPIPYRVKNLWGVSNLQGKIILPAAYDEIIWSADEMSRMPPGYYKVKKNGTTGLIHTKEIIPPVYQDVYVYQSVLIKAYKGNKAQDFFTLDGKKILPDSLKGEDVQVIQLLKPANGSKFPAVIALFHVQTSRGEKGCYFYHQNQPKASRLLLYGYDRINYRLYKKPAGFTIYLNNRSGFKQEVHYLLNPATMELKEVFEKPEEQEERKSEFETREYTITDSEHLLSVPEAEAPVREKMYDTVRKVRYAYKNDSLFAYVYAPRTQRRNSESTPIYIPLPSGSFDVKLHDFYGEYLPSFTRKDTTYQYQNVVLYKIPQKQVLLSDMYGAPFSFDSLQLLRKIGENRFEFVFGLKDAQGKMQYGIRNLQDSILLPAVYQHLSITGPGAFYFARKGKARFAVKQQNRWGIMEEDGQMLVPCVYDSVYAVFGKEAGIPFHVLVKNKKFGVYVHTTEISAPRVWREPFTIHPPVKLVFILQPDRTNLTLVQHHTPEGKLIGLSGDKGRAYWKD